MSDKVTAAQEQAFEDLRALNRQLDEYERLKRTHKILFYEPIGEQHKFFSSKARTRCVFGSNRSGKSVVGTLELIACAMGYRPWLPVDHPDREVKLGDGSPMPVPNVGFHLLENFNTSGKMIFLAKMAEWLPKDWGKVKTNSQGQPVSVKFTNGSICHIYSQQMDINALEGPNGHYFSCDEPPKENFWIAIRRGLVDFDGISWITATPIKASYFMAELMEKCDEDTTSENYDLITLNIYDNMKSRGGYLPDRAVHEFVKSLPPDEVEARVYGRPKHLAGSVYKEWLAAPPYCIDPFEIPEEWPRIMAIDPAERKPMAAVWIAISPDNKWFVYRDVFDPALRTTEQFANYVKQVEGWEQRYDGSWYMGPDTEPVAFRLIDTAGNKLERSSGYSISTALRNEDIYVSNATKQDFAGGVDRVRSMLTFDPEYEWDTGPQLVVFNTCRRVMYEFRNYIWQQATSQSKASGADLKDKPLASNDDALDCIRYLAVSQATYHGLKGLLRQQGIG